MIKENKSEFDILGISRWHDLGIKGRGIKVANLEKTYPTWFLQEQLRATFDYNLTNTTNTHGQKTMDCINQAAPEAELYPLFTSTATLLTDTLPFIIKNNIHLVNASLTSSNNDDKDKLIKQCVDDGTIFAAAAGNTGKEGIKGYPKNPLFMAVGAVHCDESLKKINRASYSTMGPELFVTCFSNLWLRDGKDKNKLIPSQQGTSFSSPLYVGMLALVQNLFLDSIKTTLTKDEMEQFVKEHVIDLGEIGHDNLYGHGLFTLPEPSTIDFTKYKTKEPIVVPEKPKEDDNKMARFTDINNHWAEGAIEYVAEKGLMKGYEEGQPGPADDTFNPDKPITRAELAAVLARMNGYVEKK